MSRARLMSFAAASLALSASVALAQQQPPQDQKQGPTGEARIVERQGPKVELKQGARPVAAVIFTGAAPSQSQAQPGELVISILESDPQNAGNDREAVFEMKNAQDGVVTHDFTAQGAGNQAKRTLIITARRGSEAVQVEQVGSAGNNAMIYAVRKAKPEAQQQPAVAAQPPAAGQPAAAAAPAPAPPQDEAQQAAAREAAEKQKQEQQKQQAEAAPAEENDAVIMLYMIGTAK